LTVSTSRRAGAVVGHAPARRPGARRGRGSRGYFWFLLPGLLLSAVVIVAPVIMNVWLSFTSWQGVGDPQWIGTRNYSQLFRDENFWASFQHTGAIVVAMAIVPTLLGLVIAAVLFDYLGKKFSNRTASVLRSGLYIPQVLPVAVSGIVWGWLLMPSGAVNELLNDVGLGGLTKNWLGDPDYALPSVMGIMVWIQLGYPVVMFMAGLQRVNPELYEAAEVDGATWWQRFTRITVPQVRPELYVVLVTTTIAALKTFAQVFVLTRGGPGNATLVPSYFAYRSFFQEANVGYGSAISSIMVLIILIVGIVFVRLQTRADRDALR
jgi:raffinose/stachyose/melibiose transport system permease protein